MRLALVTDSPADLPEAWRQHYAIQVVPATLILDGQPFLDGIELTREEFYQRLPSLKRHPTTAAPSPLDFSIRYRAALQAGAAHVLGIFTSEKLTSIPTIARQAAAEFPGQVTVLESGSLSLGIGFQVLAAAQACAQGFSLAEILQSVQSTRRRLAVGAALDTMEYLRRGGRVPAAITSLGGLLHLRPVVELREGVVRLLGAARTTAAASQHLLQFLRNQGNLERLAILHTNSPQRAADFLDACRRAGLPLPAGEIPLVNVTTVIGAHVGPNGVGFAAIRAQN